MLHRPWTYTARLVARMADSAMQHHNISRPARSEGLHASTLLRKLHPPPTGEITEEQLSIYGLMGLAFEDRAEHALLSLSEEEDWPWAAVRPGEVSADGIACSPDILLTPKPGFDVDERELSLKVKWASTKGLPLTEEGENEFPKKFDYVLSQCMTYAYPLRTRGSILLVYFVCGNWKPPTPCVHGWELEFSSQEIAENWSALTTLAYGD